MELEKLQLDNSKLKDALLVHEPDRADEEEQGDGGSPLLDEIARLKGEIARLKEALRRKTNECEEWRENSEHLRAEVDRLQEMLDRLKRLAAVKEQLEQLLPRLADEQEGRQKLEEKLRLFLQDLCTLLEDRHVKEVPKGLHARTHTGPSRFSQDGGQWAIGNTPREDPARFIGSTGPSRATADYKHAQDLVKLGRGLVTNLETGYKERKWLQSRLRWLMNETGIACNAA